MTHLVAGLRLLAYALTFLLLVGPHWLALRFGRGTVAGHAPAWLHRVFLRLFQVRITVAGTPPAAGEAALVLANHISWLDIPVLGSLRPLSFVAKSEIAGWPVIGTLARLQRTLFIDRGRKRHTAVVNTEMSRRLRDGDLIVLFAEGTTGDGTRLLPFRTSLVGAARAAISEGGIDRVRLQPLCIAYTRRHGLPLTRAERPDVAWYGDMALAPSVTMFFERGPIDVTVTWGEPIAFSAGTDRKAATALAEAGIRRALQEAVTGRPPAPVRDPAPEAPRADAPPAAAAPPILIPAATA
ncbi:lysophospholipid acyltransferase family protein [Methylobacterium platani]|uniref:Acyl-phosphate glycerol 3-phosphate acyltransferase n=2 Tax=Methylobacterium platani TaxID=427683 RepID=A0A179S4U1_9HYPH|nr:lysophospholipid acyltransferase family protein [Methylobacterium platani]KMO14064.1 acyl-phosphate glycerol 3-phosphate acyltransferase [Methylobacterium platani JCM 14648]OAS21995.1 acyl-phosphate glycerol 3-phosphate acyltransferase [Methylobacterium platani]